MSVRVVGEHDARRLLPMQECIEAMEAALASLARDELHNPLRFVVRPPGSATLMGLMPAYRSEPVATYSLKTATKPWWLSSPRSRFPGAMQTVFSE